MADEIEPIKQIRRLLTEFETRIPVWGFTVFTVDGYILAYKLFYDGMPEAIESAVSSMSAGLITIAQDFIIMIDPNVTFKQLQVDAETTEGELAFSILLQQVAENVLLACIFPSSVQLGLVTFELENLKVKIQEIVNLWEVKLHKDTMT